MAHDGGGGEAPAESGMAGGTSISGYNGRLLLLGRAVR
jgi:hypothetical protein